MFTKTRDWRRWSGPRDELLTAIELASSELEGWNSFPSTTDIDITYAHQLNQSDVTIDEFRRLHKTDLQKIETLTIRVLADTGLHRNKEREIESQRFELRSQGATEEAKNIADPPKLVPGISVRFDLHAQSFWGKSLSVSVAGRDQTSVEGLMKMIVGIFNRSKTGPTWIRGGFSWFSTYMGALLGLWLGIGARTLLDALNGHKLSFERGFETGAVSATLIGAFVGAFLWSIPPLEILDTGEPSRYQRFRKGLYAWFAMIVTGFIVLTVWSATH